MKEFVKVFRALAEPTRQRIVKLLALQGLYVCELEQALGVGQSNVSQHLRVLKEARLVREEKEGWWTRYSLDREYMNRVLKEWDAFLEQPLDDTPGFEDVAERIRTWQTDPTVASCRPDLRRSLKPNAKA